MATKPILFNYRMVQAIMEGQKTQTRRIVKKKYDNTDLVMFTNKYGTRLVERQNDAPPPRKYTDENGVQHTVTHMVAQRELEPPFKTGDILWVRETWRLAKGIMHTYINGEVAESGDWHDGFEYKAGGYHFPDGFAESNDEFHLSEIRSGGSWNPSIFMPKEAARIFLRVKDVRTEPLHGITRADCLAEGIREYTKDGKLYKYGVAYGDTTTVQWCDMPDCPVIAFADLWDSTVKPCDHKTYGWNANPWVWVIKFERCDKPEGWCAPCRK